ncbi:Septal ring factor EnvC, activator of murein hydrolases AmiA and AmiB [Desulfonauticus submarinus]|uniref:Septal ring factor EnvC, activator of murein hydrolases AmiA and AmiB n=1 Tax=Desulfonauticus submarinus TaxID=206665 RepID=A0A1H0AIL5_9BACT|nr:peptidoglycan DD-metalloendopeptidase family protein [Desulfonauticus submarinus]SDN33370.1 Septal ring factor EnvC, activator of murein hydrolases AmiA and AmiB [Desulfonauticus submarinus]
MSPKQYLKLLVFFIICLFLFKINTQVSLASLKKIQSELKSYKIQIKNKKSFLKKLSSKEKKIIKQLTKVDNEIVKITQKLQKEEEKLSLIKRKEAYLLKNYQITSKRKEKLKKDLKNILDKIWPIYLQNKTLNIFDTKNEERWQLKIKLMNILLDKVSKIYKEFSLECQKISSQLIELQKLIEERKKQLKQINLVKDSLLEKKLFFLKKIQETRLVKLKEEENLQQILHTVESLNYKLLILTNRKFSKAKGHLPWPAKGKLKVKFNLKKHPPCRGIGLRLPKNSPIKAIFWGKVVHNDVLRGFGEVIILSHGQGYYSLYAFLSKSFVKIGQNVEKGEVIGLCGYYPKLKNYGLYFELRFKQKPVNPIFWLSKF